MLLRLSLARLALVLTVLGGVLYSCVGLRQTFVVNEAISNSQEIKDPEEQTVVLQIKYLPSLLPVQPTLAIVPRLQPSCLAGSWSVNNLQQVLMSSFAEGSSTLELESVEGETVYEFTSAGEIKILFNHLSATMQGVEDGMAIEVLQLLEGSATAHYQVDETRSELVLTDFGGEGIFSTLDINGQRLAEGNLPVWKAFTSGLSNGADAIPTPLVAFSRVAVRCTGDQLSVHAIEPYPGPVVDLHRMR